MNTQGEYAMNYRSDKYGNQISILGYGCMRFTQKVGGIDLDKAEKEVMRAIEGGVNYFDTAYIYPGSEVALGEILERNHVRDRVNIATKLPHYLIKSSEGMEKYFAEELRRLRTDHVDYYLMHMLNDLPSWERLIKLGILTWLEEKKASGAIRQVGFSYHGNSDTFMKLLDAYEWDFCQIQYNYLDEHSQAGRVGLKYAAQKGIPVIIMEPLRGGKLVNNLPKTANTLFENHPIKKTPAEWAFTWLWDQPEVTCVLSGMNSSEMVDENIRSASGAQAGMLTESDKALLAAVVESINANMKVGCTGCRYCMPCPKNVDIPGIFALYNRTSTDKKMPLLTEYIMCTSLRHDYSGPANCIGCGKCEQHCPQQIAIRDELKNAKAAMEGPLYRLIRKVLPHVMKY